MFLTHTLYGSPANDVSRLFASVGDLAEPQLVHAEHAPGVPVLGVERDALPREIRRRTCTAARAPPARRASRRARRRVGSAASARCLSASNPAWSCVRYLIAAATASARSSTGSTFSARSMSTCAAGVVLETEQHLGVQDVRVRVLGIHGQRAREAASRRRLDRRPAAGAPRRAARADRSDLSAELRRTSSALRQSCISGGTARRAGSSRVVVRRIDASVARSYAFSASLNSCGSFAPRYSHGDRDGHELVARQIVAEPIAL